MSSRSSMKLARVFFSARAPGPKYVRIWVGVRSEESALPLLIAREAIKLLGYSQKDNSLLSNRCCNFSRDVKGHDAPGCGKSLWQIIEALADRVERLCSNLLVQLQVPSSAALL